MKYINLILILAAFIILSFINDFNVRLDITPKARYCVIIETVLNTGQGQIMNMCFEGIVPMEPSIIPLDEI